MSRLTCSARPRAGVLILVCLTGAACGGGPLSGPREGPPASVAVTLIESTIELRQFTIAAAVALDPNGAPIAGGTPSFGSADPAIASVSPTTGLVFGVAEGTTQVTATIEGRTGRQTLTVFRPAVRINEVEPDGDEPGGWVELHNPTGVPVDLSLWSFSHADPFQRTVLPLGLTIAARGYVVIEESAVRLGLAHADGLRLFSRYEVELEAVFWQQDAITTYGKCPGHGNSLVTTLAPTKGGPNACP